MDWSTILHECQKFSMQYICNSYWQILGWNFFFDKYVFYWFFQTLYFHSSTNYFLWNTMMADGSDQSIFSWLNIFFWKTPFGSIKIYKIEAGWGVQSVHFTWFFSPKGPLHDLSKVYFGCWVTWSISSWQECLLSQKLCDG